MVTFREAVQTGARQAFCNYLGDVDRYYSFFGGLGVPAGEVPRGWKKFWCDEPGPPPPPPPFTGGQCPGTRYDVCADFDIRQNEGNDVPGSACISSASPLYGPIREVRGDDESSTEEGLFRRVIAIGRNATNTQDVVRELINSTVFRYSNISNIQVTPFPGEPDDCGNPPPVTPPPPGTPPVITVPITYDDPNGDPVTEPGDFTIFAPIIVPVIPVTVYAPITLELPDAVFNGTLEISPDFDINFDFGGGDSSPGAPSNPSLPPADPISSPDTPLDDSQEFLMGVVVRSQPTGNTSQTELEQDNAPILYVPRIGSVYFRTRNRNVNAWNGPHDIKTRNCYIPVPENVTAVDARVDLQPGWSGSISQIIGTRNPS